MSQPPFDDHVPDDEFRTAEPEHAAESRRPGWLLPVLLLVAGIAAGVAAWLLFGPDSSDPAASPSPTGTASPSASPATPSDPSTEPSDTPTEPEGDAEAPAIQAGPFDPNEIHDEANTLNCDESAEVAVTVADNVGVATVTAEADVAGVTVAESGTVGDTWTFTAQASGMEPLSTQDVTVTFTATDAAGNSSTASASLRVFGDGMCAD